MEDYKRLTLESYRQNATAFYKNFKDVFDLERRKEFVQFISLLSGKRVLDVGCGSGDHAAWFRTQGLEVSAIDLSPAMVELARSKGVDARVMDMEHLTFNEHSFDGIWAVTSLLHIPKEQTSFVLSSLSSLLVPQGILFIVVKEGEGEGFIVDKLNPSTQRFFAYWQKGELLELFRPYFSLIDFWKQDRSGTVFLHFLLRKK